MIKTNKNLFLLIGGIFAVLLVIILFVTTSSKKRETVPQTRLQPTVLPLNAQKFGSKPNDGTPAQSFGALQQAVDEARQSAQDYDSGQSQIRSDYPWIRKLPISDGRYYVYFDLQKNAFIGKLYPKAGDNVEQLKVEALKKLSEKQIPVSYEFEWIVTPVN